jgi:hypothetical protein
MLSRPSHSGGTAPDLHRIPLPSPPSMMSHLSRLYWRLSPADGRTQMVAWASCGLALEAGLTYSEVLLPDIPAAGHYYAPAAQMPNACSTSGSAVAKNSSERWSMPDPSCNFSG